MDMATTVNGGQARQWPGRVAAVVAVGFGVMMMLMGGGHLSAILGRFFDSGASVDYRFVSLVSTGAFLLLPGLVALVSIVGLWRGRRWAFVACAFSAVVLLAYLGLLHLIQDPAPGEPVKLGRELHIATAIVGAWLLVVVFAWIAGTSRVRTP